MYRLRKELGLRTKPCLSSSSDTKTSLSSAILLHAVVKRLINAVVQLLKHALVQLVQSCA
jgi:hypothetical protein